MQPCSRAPLNLATILVVAGLLAGTADAVPMGTGTIHIELQGTPDAFTACSISTFDNQTYNVFGVDVNLASDLGGMQCNNVNNDPVFDCSASNSSVFAFNTTPAGVCVNPPSCSTQSFITSSITNITGTFAASLGADVTYSLDGLVDSGGTLSGPTIPGCTLVGTVYTFNGPVSLNAFQTQSTSTGANQTVSFPATTFVNPLDNQNIAVDVGVTFAQVTGAGTTTVTATSNAAGALPANFVGAVNGYQAAYLDVSTTAAVQPPITICSTYTDADNDGFIDGTAPPISESAISFLHGEGDPKVFVDRTFSRDPVNNVICAQVDSLSPFVVAVNVATPTPTPAPGGSCAPTPLGGCATPGKAVLVIKDTVPIGASANDKLVWKWLEGPATQQSAFGDPALGDPTMATGYTFCVYTGPAQTKTMEADVPLSNDWKAIGNGYRYKAPPGSPAGVTQVLLKGGTSSKVMVKGKGGTLNLTPFTLPFDGTADVLVQLSNSDNSNCWQATFPAGSVKKNNDAEFKAKTP